MSSVSQGSGQALGRSTATISISQTAPIRIHHLTENLCADDAALRRSLPDAVADALQLCARPTADAVALDKTLGRDPALAGQIVAIAGAGLFAPRATILTVRDAVMHLGIEALRDVLLMIVTNGMALRLPRFEAAGEALRRRALAAAIATRLCAKTLRVESAHDFLIGLLHDVGELVLLQRCGEEGILAPAMLEDPNDGPVIRETLHEDHARVGTALCRAWKLPAPVIEAAEFHHDHKNGRKPRLAAHLAAAADVIAEAVTAAPGTEPSADPTRHPVLTELALPPAVAGGIIADVAARLPAFVAVGSTAQR